MHLTDSPFRFGEYAYTDVSVGFFEKAREKFDFAEKHMRFAKLDLELDPELQGFEKGTYDVIMYVNLSLSRWKQSSSLSRDPNSLCQGFETH